ncbi:MAG: hypothetical protein IKL37_05910, partial [Alphaproteobacteria bacterium]|nr:hypothetical protein [Alphaproteobacteria bacterium]
RNRHSGRRCERHNAYEYRQQPKFQIKALSFINRPEVLSYKKPVAWYIASGRKTKYFQYELTFL